MKKPKVPNKGTRLYTNLINQIRQVEKKPKSPGKHIGVEIECLSNKTHEEISEGLANAGVGKYCQVKTDHSLEDRTYIYAIEVCVIAPQRTIFKIVSVVCRVLKNYECIVNKTCGLHVHLDMRSRSAKNSYKRLVDKQKVLEKYVDKSRVNGHFSKRNHCNNLDMARCEGEFWRYTRMTDDNFKAKYKHLEPLIPKAEKDANWGKYLAINYKAINKHNTIECRLHEGTLDSYKINEWVKLLVNITDGKAA